MITKFIRTTWDLWLRAEGQPPLWKCMAAAYLVSTAKTNMIGSTNIDELVELEEEKR